MTSHVSEERLALYLSGDLANKQHGNVARHIAICPECQTALADLSESYQLLMTSLEDPKQEELAVVRSAVLQKIRPRSTKSGPWIWSMGCFAAALMIVLVLARHGERQELPPVARLPRPAPHMVAMPSSPRPPVTAHVARARHKRIEPGMRAATLITEAGRPAILKMSTADPSVVILWQLEENEKVATP